MPPSPSPAIPLRAGPLTALFEPEIGFLRYIRLGSVEIVRGIYAAVREPEWGTPAPQLSDLTVRQSADEFEIRFVSHVVTGAIDFRWDTTITGSSDGAIRYAIVGAAARSFQTARTGLCLLHPVRECAGQACVVETCSGTSESTAFPDLISPHQPFFDIRAITHEVVPGVRARVLLEGDAFEMEDQRNWTDASFKTYCRPLSLPRPYELAAGEAVQQSVTVQLLDAVDTGGDPGDASPRITLGAGRGPLPAVGLGMGDTTPRLVPDWLFLTRPAHLRVDLHLDGMTREPLRKKVQRAYWTAFTLRSRLEVALFLTDSAAEELALVAEALERYEVARCLVFHATARATPEPLLRLAREVLSARGLSFPIGGGSNLNFTDLNRHPLPVDATDFVCFPANPQVHAFDDRTVMENLEGQAHAVRAARALAPGRPVLVSPVTLRPRFNAEGPPRSTCDPVLSVDPRQRSLFTAAWTVGSLHQLAAAGAGGITYFEAEGERGVMDAEVAFPVFHVLADVGECVGGELVEVESSRPLEVECFAATGPDDGLRILVANLTDRPVAARLALPAASVTLRLLDDESVAEAMRDPVAFRKRPGAPVAVVDGELELELSAFAVARIDLEAFNG